jgi:dTDP-glucose 4,6-dehydratase
MTILVTGGFGFIGSAFVRRFAMLNPETEIVVLDNFTYAANFANLSEVISRKTFGYYQGDVADPKLVRQILDAHSVKTIVHFAAESHVDNSIKSATPFLHSNVYGTVNLLEQVKNINPEILFLHVSTDEVFGSLKLKDPPFTERTPYAPRSPYAASKAASDHFVRSFNVTHGLRTIITNCSNNYGPYQHPEKFIPTVIWKALKGEKVPVYGTGMNMRDWLYVDDHVDALIAVMERGKVGEQYCIGGGTQKTNVNLAMEILGYLGKSTDLIQFVEDRKGHDFRYDIDSSKLFLHTGWKPYMRFDRGLGKTVDWYRNNLEWVMTCRSASESYSQAEKARACIPQRSPLQSKFFQFMTNR